MSSIPEMGENMSPKALIWRLAVTLTLDVLNSNSSQFIFVPDCI